MRQFRLAIWLLIGLGGVTGARADVIADSTSLPVLDSPYISTAGAGCFSAASVCVSAGSLTLTSVVSSNFPGGGQDITADASFVGELTDLSNDPLGSMDLTGTLSEDIVGRLSDGDTGSWTAELTALSLSGGSPAGTLEMTLHGSNSSEGTTSIVADGGTDFLVHGFFDVFFDLTLDGTQTATEQGAIRFDLEPVPEPAGMAVLAAPLLALAMVRRRRVIGASIGRRQARLRAGSGGQKSSV